MDGQKNIAVILFVVVVILFGGFIAYDVMNNDRLNGVNGKTETNWEWKDDWKRSVEPISKKQQEPKQEEEAPREQITASDYQDALDKSGQTGMPVLVFFEATWCSWCKKMKDETLTNADVKEMMKNYILVKIDVDKNRAIARKFGIKSLPSYLITNCEETKLKMGDGYLDASKFNTWLNDSKLFKQPKKDSQEQKREDRQLPEKPEVQPQRRNPGC